MPISDAGKKLLDFWAPKPSSVNPKPTEEPVCLLSDDEPDPELKNQIVSLPPPPLDYPTVDSLSAFANPNVTKQVNVEQRKTFALDSIDNLRFIGKSM
jgi:hypothetical protein